MNCLSLLAFVLLYAHQCPPAGNLTFINPTGTYLLKGDVKRNNITGHFGELRVQLLDSQTVAFCFYISNGYPDYSIAAALDTLHYEDNLIRYRPRKDSTCFLVLSFSARSVEIMKVFTDPGTGCGFTPGIVVPATFEKTSSERPIIQDFSQRKPNFNQ